VFWAFAGGIVLRLLGIGQKAAQHGVSQLERHVQTLPSLAGSRGALSGAERRRRRSREDLRDFRVGDMVMVVKGREKGLSGEVVFVGSGPSGDKVSVALDNPVQRMLGPKIFDTQALQISAERRRSREAARRGGKNTLDKEIERIYYQHGQNVQIGIMDIVKIFAAGRAAHTAGQPMEPAIVDAIAKYRVNERRRSREVSRRKSSELTEPANEGFDAAADARNPYIASSPNAYAWALGRMFKATGRTRPRDVRMGRGYTIHGNDMLFDADTLERIR
jgi:hypothetical protein